MNIEELQAAIHEGLKQPEIDPYEWMRNAARGLLPVDHIGDLALEIVEEIQSKIVDLETSWHDGELQDVTEKIIREALPQIIEKLVVPHLMTALTKG